MLSVLFAFIAIIGLVAISSIAMLSARVHTNFGAIGLLALLVAYVTLRQLSPIQTFVDELAKTLIPFLLAILLVMGRTLPSVGPKHGPLKGLLIVEYPRTMYEDESATITVYYTDSMRFFRPPGVVLLRRFLVRVPGTLTVTVQAAGFDVADRQTRSKSFSPDSAIPSNFYAIFDWNVRPKSSGNFDFNVLAEISNGTKTLAGRFPLKLRVNKFMGLTANQIWILAGAFGLITGLASIGSFLFQLFDR